jgi:arsenate reductase (glutaredoxin)
MSFTIYHNPKCKISRDVLKALRGKGIEPIVVEYMKDPPGRSDLVRLLNLLRLSPKDIIREKEARQLGINRNAMELNAALDTIARNPGLIERPIVVNHKGGRICASPEVAEQFISETMAFA